MAKYKDTTTGEVIEVGSPELNPDLIAGKIQVPDTTPFGTINSSTLAQSTPTDFKTTSAPSVPDVSKLDTSVLTPTPQEKKADDLSTQLQDIQNRLLGQSAFRVEKEKEMDVEGLRKTQTDLSARLKAIQNEAQAIPLQLQTEATGRGITAGGLAPLQTERLRANAIQALSTSSLLEASRGNLTTALDMVDRAVAAKYDPIKEKIGVQLANLELILKSPSYTLAEKNRAEALKAKIEAQKKVDAKQELEEKEIGIIAVESAKKGVDALTLKKIQESKTSQEALALASPFLAEKEKPVIKDYEVGGRLVREVLDPMTGRVISKTDLGAKDKPIDILNREAEITAYAQQYAADGKIPPGMPKELLASVSKKAKALPKQKGQILDGSTGLTPTGETTLTNAMSGISSAIELAKQLKELDKERIKGLIPALGGKIIGTSAQQRYVDLKSQIVDLLARARTGAVLTEAEEKFYGGLLPGRIGQIGFGLFGVNTQDRIDNFINNLSADLQNKASAKGWVINGLSKVNLGGQEYTVGQEIEVNGVRGRILPDGSISTQ